MKSCRRVKVIVSWYIVNQNISVYSPQKIDDVISKFCRINSAQTVQNMMSFCLWFIIALIFFRFDRILNNTQRNRKHMRYLMQESIRELTKFRDMIGENPEESLSIWEKYHRIQEIWKNLGEYTNILENLTESGIIQVNQRESDHIPRGPQRIRKNP